MSDNMAFLATNHRMTAKWHLQYKFHEEDPGEPKAVILGLWRDDDAPDSELSWRAIESSDGSRTIEHIVVGPADKTKSSGLRPPAEGSSKMFQVHNPKGIFQYGEPDDKAL